VGEKYEGKLKSAFGAELKKQLPNFLTLMFATRAASDRLIVGNGVSTFWEFKHGTPDFDVPGDQLLMCMRLDVQGRCRFVIWEEQATGIGKRTMIVKPREVYEARKAGRQPLPEIWTTGFNHKWLVDHIKTLHRV
jgi:hypothetical protein